MSVNEKFKPYLTEEQFEALHAAVDKCRSKKGRVKVDRQALVNLLMDHSSLWDHLGVH